MSGALLTATWAGFAIAALVAHRPRPAVRSLRPIAPLVGTELGARVDPASFPGIGSWRRRRQARRIRRAMDAEVPDLVDLFAVAVGAGLNVRLAVEAVGRRVSAGSVSLAFRDVVDDVAAGAGLAEALETLSPRLGSESIRPLVSALVDAQRYGTALGPSLDRLADEARRSRQRRAEEAARRVPVKLLFPLVACVLPAFGLLTVAPLIAGGLRALRP